MRGILLELATLFLKPGSDGTRAGQCQQSIYPCFYQRQLNLRVYLCRRLCGTITLAVLCKSAFLRICQAYNACCCRMHLCFGRFPFYLLFFVCCYRRRACTSGCYRHLCLFRGGYRYIYMYIYNICITVVLRPSCFIAFLRGLLLPQNVVSVYVPLIFV